MSLDDIDFKSTSNKILKGCGCLSIGSFAFFILVGIIATLAEDDEKKDDDDNGKRGEERLRDSKRASGG